MIHGINYAMKLTGWWTGIAFENAKETIFWLKIHYAFSIPDLMGFSPQADGNRLMEKQIKLITSELHNDINKASLGKNNCKKKTNRRTIKYKLQVRWWMEWKEKWFLITQADHISLRMYDAHFFFMKSAPNNICF